MDRMNSSSLRVALVLFTIALGSAVRLQAQAFNVADNVVGLSFGVGGNYNTVGNSYSSQTPAIGVSFENGFKELGPGVLGLGGYIGYKSLSSETRIGSLNYDWTYNYLIMGVRGTWHYNEWHGDPNWDTYGGLMLGYSNVTFKDNTNYPSGTPEYNAQSYSGINLSAYLGARYYFTDNFGAHAELGYGIAVLNLGVSYKF